MIGALIPIVWVMGEVMDEREVVEGVRSAHAIR